MDGEKPSDRLKLFRENMGLRQGDVARAVGRSQGLVARFERGAAEPSQTFLRRLNEAYGVSTDWILFGSGEMFLPQQPEGFSGRTSFVAAPDRTKPAHGDVKIDEVEFQRLRRWDVRASAGAGLVAISEEVVDQVAVTTQWLAKNGINGDLAGLIQVTGDSMVPTIASGSLALLHRAEMEIVSGEIYAFSIGDEVFVKRLYRISEDGRQGVLISSDNPAHERKKVFGHEASEIRIAGRIRAVITTL